MMQKKMKNIEYIRILGFNDLGKKYLNSIKKECKVPIVTNFSPKYGDMLLYEKKVTSVYLAPLDEKQKKERIKEEYQNPPKKKEF